MNKQREDNDEAALAKKQREQSTNTDDSAMAALQRGDHSDQPQSQNESNLAAMQKAASQRNYAKGGWVDNPDMPPMNEVGQGMKEGVNHDLDAVKAFLMQLYNSPQVQNGNPNMSPTLPGLQGLANQAAGTPAANAVTTDNGFAEGGMVDDGSDFLNKLNQGNALTAPPTVFDPKAGLPPAPAPVAPPQAMPNPDISGYLAQQKVQLGKYGPEQQMAVSNDILGRQNGLRGNIANAGTGLADALMQGVARAGPSNFQANLQNRQDKQAELQLQALQNARQGNMQNVEMGQKLDAMDPNSKLSKATQASQGLFLASLGFDPKTISQMSASQIPEAINTIKDLGIKDREIAVAKFKAQIEANQLAETTKHNRTQEGIEGGKLAEEAKQHLAENAIKGEDLQSQQLEKAAAIPLTSRIANMFGANPAQAELERQALKGTGTSTEHGIPDLGSTFNGQKVLKVRKIN